MSNVIKATIVDFRSFTSKAGKELAEVVFRRPSIYWEGGYEYITCIVKRSTDQPLRINQEWYLVRGQDFSYHPAGTTDL